MGPHPVIPTVHESDLEGQDDAIYFREDPLRSPGAIDRTGNILRALSDADYSIVLKRAVIRQLKKNEPVLTQGKAYDGIFIIQSGRVRTYYVSPGGREYTLAYWTSGHFVGVPEVYGTGENLWAAVTVTPSTTLAVLSSADILWLIAHVPAFSIALVEGLVYKGRCLSTAVQMLGTRSMTSRLAYLLLTLGARHGVQSGTRVNIAETFTHEELAKMIGSTRQWVTASINQFRSDRLIECSNHSIKILDPKGLQELLR